MRHWWVNQNQTYRYEVRGGYLWSPKRNKNGQRNPFYDFMREVAPGDVIFSFADTLIKAIGTATSHAYEAPKPLEFGQTGAYWEQIGWRVDVGFAELSGPIRPADHMALLAPMLPARYSPLQSGGSGLQGIYLTLLPASLAGALIDTIGREAHDIVDSVQAAGAPAPGAAVGLVEWEEHEVEQVQTDQRIPETERKAIVLARRGQGLFKERVMRVERACRITGVDRVEHLRASHCKPWRDSTNDERLNGDNGLLLTPNADHLFDRGFIGFEDDGELLVSPVAHLPSMAKLGVDPSGRTNVGQFSSAQQRFLAYHREHVLLKSRYIAAS